MALSFFNDLEEDVFKKFESGKKESEFEVEIHSNLPKKPFINATTLYVYQHQTKKWVEYPMKISDNGQHRLKSKFNTVNDSEVKIKLLNEVGSRFFLSVTFSDEHLSDKVGYKQYNYDSPWTFPISFINKKEAAQKSANIAMANGGYVDFNGHVDDQTKKLIQGIVDNTFGYRIEVSSKSPDFKWYQKIFPNDYSTGKASPKPVVSHPDFQKNT